MTLCEYSVIQCFQGSKMPPNKLNIIVYVAMILLLASCSAPVTKQLSQDTFVVFKEDRKGIFGSSSALKQEVMNEVHRIAEQNGGKAVEISSYYHPVGILGDWASYKYEFRIVKPDAFMTPYRASTISLRCLSEVAIDYDSGKGDVAQLSEAIVNRCSEECIDNQLSANNHPYSFYNNYYQKCSSMAKDIIYRMRSIKRNGGETNRFDQYLFLKRSHDMHYKNIFSVIDDTKRLELSFQCQIGKRSAEINSHSINLSAIDSVMWPDYKTEDVVKVDINGVETVGISSSNGEEIEFPNVDVTRLITNTDKINVSFKQKSFKFSTLGKEVVDKIRKECQL